MGVLLLLNLYLIGLFSSIFVRADDQLFVEKKEALHVARCVSRCGKDKTCRQECVLPDKFDAILLGEKGPNFSGPVAFNATLHCKDIDIIRIRHNAGIWVIEEVIRNEDSWNNTGRIQVSDKGTSTFRNLLAGTSYRYKAYKILENDVISEPEISPWFSTSELGHRPEGLTDLKVTNRTLDETNPSRLRADIIFQPASDRSCRYDIVSWNEDEGLTIAEFDSLQDFRFSLQNLDYETNVTVFVSARSMGSSMNSKNASLVFVTPSCLEMHRNLTLCAPDGVEDLRISKIYENGSTYEIFVAWDKPEFIPDNYLIQFQYFNNENDETPLITLSGNSTETVLTIQKSEIDNRQRIISIIAESPGGTSAQTSIYVDVKETLNISSTKGTISKPRSENLNDGIVVVSMLAAFTVSAGIAYACYLCFYKRRTNDRNNGYKYCRNLKGGDKHLKRSSYAMDKNSSIEFENKFPLISKDLFEIRPIQLTITEVLGSGVSGIVRFGRFQTAKNRVIDVAVKTLRDDSSTEDLKNFRQEISIMKSVGHHPNIVSIIGCCTLDIRRPVLVVEFCSRGDLQTYLRTLWQRIMSEELERRARCKIAIQENVIYTTPWIAAHEGAVENKLYDIQEDCTLNVPKDEKDVTIEDLLNFARQVASGMEYLSANRTIHRDLAARNVLVCADKTVKISDFGLSRDIYQENVYKKEGNGLLPLKWMAIEALTHQIYTTKSDVWSFGVLLWEIVTLGSNPYPETPTNMVLQLLKSGYRMKKPENCGNELYDIMRSCWHSRPRCRPNFTQLKNQLDCLLRTISGSEYLNILREPVSDSSSKPVDNHYSNIYSK